MESDHILLLLALLVPLTLDTFIVSTALGLGGLPKKHRLRTSLTLALFEAVMPAVGVLLGHGIAGFAGNYAGYAAGIVLAVAGIIMLLQKDEPHGREESSQLVMRTRGWAIINLGLSISIDELALGFSLGLLHVPLLLAVVLIGLQAFGASQLGLRVGERLGQRFREHAEKIAGLILIAVGAVIVALNASGSSL